MTEKLRVICFQEESLWLAQILEHDICVQAESLDDLAARLEVAVRLECEETGNLDHIPAAPAHFEKMWDRNAGGFTPDFGKPEMYDVAMAA